MNFEHGGNIYKAAQNLGCDVSEIVDFSSNVIPYVPVAIKKTIAENIDGLNRLPDPDNTQLTHEIAELFRVYEDSIVIGAGTTELLLHLCLIFSGRSALIVQPTYVDYERFCTQTGLEVRHAVIPEESGFSFDDSYVISKIDNADVVFICNPNNPTGKYIQREELQFLADMYPRTVFVIDESYMPLCDHGDETLMGCAKRNIVVLRSYSKLFGIPGLRLGYLYSNDIRLTGALRASLPPWSVSTLAQTAGMKMVHRDPSEMTDFVKPVKKMLMKRLGDIGGIKIYESDVNFVLIRLLKSNAEELAQYLINHKILIRNCANIRGLDSSFVRISVRMMKETERLADLIKKFFEDKR